jgi:hypothetical protein
MYKSFKNKKKVPTMSTEQLPKTAQYIPHDPHDDDQSFATDQPDPLEKLVERFSVSEDTAAVIASLDKGSGIHAGGYISPEDREPGVATATTSENPIDVWYKMQEKYGDRAARDLIAQVNHGSNNKTSFSSDKLKIPAGMSMKDARDLVVYGLLGPNAEVRPRPTQKFTAMDMVDGDPSVLLGTANIRDHGVTSVLEVATGEDKDGNMIGFSVASRKWNAGKYPNDTGYRGV